MAGPISFSHKKPSNKSKYQSLLITVIFFCWNIIIYWFCTIELTSCLSYHCWMQHCCYMYCLYPCSLDNKRLSQKKRCTSIVFFSCDQAALRTPLSFCLSVRPSVRLSFCLSVCLFVTPFHYVPVIISSRNFQELLPMTEVMSMQKVKVVVQRSRSQRS